MRFTKGKQYKYLFLGSFVIVTMIAGILINTLQFDGEMSKVYDYFITKNSEQLANSIADRVTTNSNIVKEFAKCLDSDHYEGYVDSDLKEKAQAMGLDDLFVLRSDAKYLEGLTSDKKCLEETQIYNKNNDMIIYISPIKIEGEVKDVLVGIEKLDNFYPVINQKDNYRYGILALVDNKTQEVITIQEGDKSTFNDEEISKILSEDVDSNKYIYSKIEVPRLGWTQIMAENNRSFMMMVASYIERFLGLILIELLVFGVLFFVEKRDIEKKKEAYFIDPVTGGNNRQGFLAKGVKCIGHNYDSYAVVVMDVCDFRRINSEWGENIGNEILLYIYKSIANYIDNKEVACRLSMDYFAILLNKKDIDARVEKIIEIINKLINTEYAEINIDFLVGVCDLEKEKDISQAVDNCIFAMKDSRKKNTCILFDEKIAKKKDQEAQLVKMFEESLKNGEFKVYLQPKISQNKEYRAEALVRWEHPSKGIIKPNKFINIFEVHGKIYELDKYMFEEVCKIIANWKAEGKKVVEISVNLSRHSLKEKQDIWKEFRDIKEKYNIEDNIIEVEITETTSIGFDEVDFIKKALKGFKLAGLKVSLDDFGVAYSSLYVLKEFDVDTIKLDRSFFIDETVKSRTIVDYTIRLAHSLGILVVAEGIEEAKQVEVLATWGCDYIQGYVYSKPLSLPDFEAWRRIYEK